LEPVVTSFSGSRGARRRGIVLDKKNEVGRDSRTPKPIGKEASGKRLVLGFDGGSAHCAGFESRQPHRQAWVNIDERQAWI
jgi:hypothetical protein